MLRLDRHWVRIANAGGAAARRVRTLAAARQTSAADQASWERSVPFAVRAEWQAIVRMLHGMMAIEYESESGVAVIPNSDAWRYPDAGLDGDAPVRLRADAFIVPTADGLLVRAPTAPAALLVRDAAGWGLFPELAGGAVRADAEVAGSLRSDVLEGLHAAGLLTPAAPAVEPAENALSLGDLLLHSTSRAVHASPLRGRRNVALPERHGRPAWLATAPIAYRFDTSPRMVAPRAATLDAFLDGRRSQREYGDRAVDVAALGETLQRAMAVNGEVTLGDGSTRQFRRFPSAGGLHTLDMFVAVAPSASTDIAAGLYLYDVAEHALRRCGGEGLGLELLRLARQGAGRDDDGQLLLIAAVDITRVACDYMNGVYAMLLKESGAWIEVVQLIGSDCGLATCPVGSGDSVPFSRGIGADPFAYTSIAEVLVGMPRLVAGG